MHVPKLFRARSLLSLALGGGQTFRYHLHPKPIAFFGEIVNDAMVLNNVGLMIKNEWLKLPQRFNDIGMQKYVVMPAFLLRRDKLQLKK